MDTIVLGTSVVRARSSTTDGNNNELPIINYFTTLVVYTSV